MARDPHAHAEAFEERHANRHRGSLHSGNDAARRRSDAVTALVGGAESLRSTARTTRPDFAERADIAARPSARDRIHSEIRGIHARDAAQKQSGADKQHHRQHRLHDRQPGSQRRSRFTVAIPAMQHLAHVATPA